jgi:hypothetical protein
MVSELDVPQTAAALQAGLDALPEPDLPDIYPGATGEQNIKLLAGYQGNRRSRFAGAYLAMLRAVQGEVNGVWFEGGHVRSSRIKPLSEALEGLPLLVLDATADEEIARALYGEDIELHRIDVAMAQGVRVVQVTDRTFAKGKAVKQPYKQPYQDRLVAFMHALAGDGSLGLISHKAVIEAIADRLPEGTLTENFNGLRGKDGLKDVQHLVIAGRIEPPSLDMEAIARALWPSAEMSLGHRDYELSETGIRHKDGRLTPVKIRQHPDVRVNRVLRQHRDEELLQALGRIRPVHAKGEKWVWMVCNVPVGLPVDATVTLDELLPSQRASRGLMAGRGVLPLATEWLMWLLQGEWPNRPAARKWARRVWEHFKETFTGRYINQWC